MFDHLKTVYEEQLLELPKINQEALKSFEWEKKLFEIARKYGLHIDQTEDFWTETMLVLVGLEPATTYEDKLMTEIAVSPADAEKITIDVNTQIFGPIHDFIIRGGPVVEKNQNPKPQEPNGANESLAKDDIHIMEREIRATAEESHTPMSFAPLIQTGVVVPLSEGEASELTTAPEATMQKSVEAVLDTQATEEPRTKYQEPSKEQSDDAVLSLESMLNGEIKPEPTASVIQSQVTVPAVSPIPISATEQEIRTKYQEPSGTNSTSEPDKRLTALEKLQKMLAEEKSTQTVVTPQETVDHSLTKSG